MIKKVLIFRLGSLGDTIVALPCFHLIARRFPDSERRLLTSLPVNDRAVSPSAVLENTGLVHGYIAYSLKRPNIRELLRLRKEIKQWGPDVLIYLAEPRSPVSAWRDALYFKGCGIKQLIGVPYTREMRENRWLSDENCFEHESERLARCLKDLGDAEIHNPKNWNLGLTSYEIESASRYLDGWTGKENFIVCSVGAQAERRKWGGENWFLFLSRLSQIYPTLSIVMVGADTDMEHSTQVVRGWKGPRLNLCGQLTPRQSATVMKQASFYIGHDSGPTHLAAAVGLSCIGVYLAPNKPGKPGVWFPYGKGHRVIYPSINGRSTMSVDVDRVFEGALSLIKGKLVPQ